MHRSITQRGVGTIEIVVVSALLVVVVGAFMYAFQTFFALSSHTSEQTQAALLLEEGSEALLFLRDRGWSEHIAPLTDGQEYHLVYTAGAYTLTGTPTPIAGEYYRIVTVADTRRDGNDVIAQTGTVDSDTRIATIEIRRVSDGAALASGSMLLHNAYEE